jgi:hypothetical protein
MTVVELDAEVQVLEGLYDLALQFDLLFDSHQHLVVFVVNGGRSPPTPAGRQGPSIERSGSRPGPVDGACAHRDGPGQPLYPVYEVAQRPHGNRRCLRDRAGAAS